VYRGSSPLDSALNLAPQFRWPQTGIEVATASATSPYLWQGESNPAVELSNFSGSSVSTMAITRHSKAPRAGDGRRYTAL
jgi:hypothetical protein